MSPRAVRPLAVVAMVGGALYAVLDAVQLASPEQADSFFQVRSRQEAIRRGVTEGWTTYRDLVPRSATRARASR